MNAVKTMQLELDRLQAAESECVTPAGHVQTACRYRYAEIVKQARALRESIAWLTDRGIGGTQ